MEEKLVTLAILTYSKAQILKTVLEAEGIETFIHNVNLVEPVISSGVRVRIKESDLPCSSDSGECFVAVRRGGRSGKYGEETW